MKQLFLLCIGCLLMTGLYAQTPQGINYQAVARNGDGVLLRDQNVDVTFTIRLVMGGNAAYVEGHSLMTNGFGLFTAVIGQGTATTGTFDELDWSQAYELGISVNGTNLGFTPFQSVPYALNVAPRRELIGIPAALFSPNNNDASFRNSIGNGGAEITSTNGASVTSVLNAPVQLPHGAVVESMTVYFTDNSEAEMRIWLAKENYSAGFAIIGEVTTTGNESGIREGTVNINHTINNEDGGYYIRVFCDDWNLSGTKQIKGAKITYTH
ncbi:hypothetical protein [Neolewinella persica]|uniref:hypothetical protein n=1 Tax=Neolewinella persica TaxID=70998 RepID=UPI0003A31A5C|nr:hypothetical protein [Neolewinella persica]